MSATKEVQPSDQKSLFHFGSYTFSTTAIDAFHQLSRRDQLTAGAAAFLLVGSAIEDPDSIPSLEQLGTGPTIMTSVGLIIFGAYALDVYLEDRVWPWNVSGWVWLWERWVWSRVYTDEEEEVTIVVERNKKEMRKSRLPVTSEERRTPEAEVPRKEDQHGKDKTPEPEPEREDDNDKRSPMIIPPTPMLPRSMRESTAQTPSSPPASHHSGLLGESPMPFKHFNGQGFARSERKQGAAVKWLMPGVTKEQKVKALDVLMEEENDESDEDTAVIPVTPSEEKMEELQKREDERSGAKA